MSSDQPQPSAASNGGPEQPCPLSERDPFDAFNTVFEDVRPPVVRHWLDYGDFYRPVAAYCWGQVMGMEEFEADSPLDGLAYAAFAEGWNVAVLRIGSMLGVDPKKFNTIVSLLGEIERDDLPLSLIQALQRGDHVITNVTNDGAATWPSDATPTSDEASQ